VKGKFAPKSENPTPEILAEFTVNGAVPLEVTVTDIVVAVPTATFPNDTDEVLTVKAGVAEFSCSETVFEVAPVIALSVAICALLTEATFAVKAVLVAVAGTITEPGTVTELLLLARLTFRPPVGAAPDRLTVHTSASDPVMEVLLQETAITVGFAAMPAPLMLTVAVGALLVIVTTPV
jgi:hypothetical protein